MVQALATYLRFTETVPECWNRRRGRAAICNNLHIIFPYDFQILFKYVQMIVREVPYVFQYMYKYTCYTNFQRCYRCLWCSFVFVSKVRQADILFDEAQREVEKCGNSEISGRVSTCSKQSCKVLQAGYYCLHRVTSHDIPLYSPYQPGYNHLYNHLFHWISFRCWGIVGSV